MGQYQHIRAYAGRAIQAQLLDLLGIGGFEDLHLDVVLGFERLDGLLYAV